MVAEDPTPQFDIETVGDEVAGHLESALERGVEIDLLMTRGLLESLPMSVNDRWEDKFGGHADFEARLHEGVSGTFNVIDHVEVCIQVPNPLSSAEPFAMIDLKDPEFAAEVHDEFVPQWESAEPLRF